VAGLVLALAVAAVVSAPDTALRKSVVGSGGNASSTTIYRLGSTAGQSSPIGESATISYELRAGYWYGTRRQAPACIDRLGDTQCDDPVNDPDDDGCHTLEEQVGAPPPKPGSTGAYDPAAWYDFYDVPVPAKPDSGPGSGANGTRNKAVTMADVLAVLFYVGTFDGGGVNPNGVDYDTIKGVDLDGDSVNDIMPPLHAIKEGLKYDRSPSPLPNPPWDAGPPNGAVTMADVLANLAQVGLDCSGPP
jgi:hypothetical protein